MNAVVREVSPYAGLSELERCQRIRHEQQFETRIRRAGLAEVSWRCTHCRQGRVTVVAHYSAQGRFISTSGHCSTHGCLSWGN